MSKDSKQLIQALEKTQAAIHDWHLGSTRPDDEEYAYLRASHGYLKGVLNDLSAALSSLQAPAEGDKVLTDEEIERLCQSAFPCDRSLDALHSRQTAAHWGMSNGLLVARDNGFLAPVQNTVVVGERKDYSIEDFHAMAKSLKNENYQDNSSEASAFENGCVLALLHAQANLYRADHLKTVSVEDIMEVVNPHLRNDSPYWKQKMIDNLRAQIEQLTKP